MADDNWASSGLAALKLRLVRSKDESASLERDGDARVKDFGPAFVYPIFGDEETIFGYKGLEVQLRFASGSLKQYLHVSYSSKFPDSAGVIADDPEKTLFEFIPPSYAKILDEFSKTVEDDAATFKPLGTKVGAYKVVGEGEGSANGSGGKGKGKAKAARLPERKWEIVDEEEGDNEEVLYEAYATTWETEGFVEFHRRMQVFVLLYIEGASYIEEDDPRWEFMTLYERRKVDDRYTYHFVGFTSFYSFFCWPDTKRLRLSQFVILPPYQGQGHGSALYTLAYNRVLARPEISELTVEDPSETFEDMRDKADLYTLIKSGEIDGLTAPVDKHVSEAIRKKYKIADRQFYRLLEMILLLNLDTSDKTKATAYRLAVKKRLYLFNKEQLLQIEPDERKEKLQETYEGVEQDYRRILKGFEA